MKRFSNDDPHNFYEAENGDWVLYKDCKNFIINNFRKKKISDGSTFSEVVNAMIKGELWYENMMVSWYIQPKWYIQVIERWGAGTLQWDCYSIRPKKNKDDINEKK